MDMEELDVTTLSAKDLRIAEAQRLVLEPNEEIEGIVNEIKAYKTEWGILFNLIIETSLNDVYSVSSWNLYITPRLINILDLKGKKVKVSNTGAKKFKLSH